MSNNKTLSPSKRCKYRLTYPLYGNKIYESKSFDKAIRKCYHEFKQMSDLHEGMFVVTDIDNKIDYTFEINSKKLKNLVTKNNINAVKHDIDTTNLNIINNTNKQTGGNNIDHNNIDEKVINVNENAELLKQIKYLNEKVEYLETQLKNKIGRAHV